MTIETFCEKYDISTALVYTQKSNGVLPMSVFYAKNAINEKHFVRRKEFNRKIQLINQDMFYYLTEFFSVDIISSHILELYDVEVSSYLNDRMFRVSDKSIINTKVYRAAWAFYKYGRKIEMAARRRVGKQFSVSYILDRRMLNEESI